jgi:hypothetical protein
MNSLQALFHSVMVDPTWAGLLLAGLLVGLEADGPSGRPCHH